MMVMKGEEWTAVMVMEEVKLEDINISFAMYFVIIHELFL